MIQPWVIIPNLNGLQWLPDCLATLRATIPTMARVLLIDNGSTDESLAFVHRQFSSVECLALAMNLGFVQAMNVGIAHALAQGATDVVLLNNDTRLRGGWLEKLLDASRQYNCGIVGPLQLDFTGKISPRCQVSLRHAAVPFDVNSSTLSPQTPAMVQTDWIEGSCMLIQREVFTRIGYLDTLYAPAYFEEVDYCRRARAAGFTVGLIPDSIIEHHGAGSSQSQAQQSWKRVLAERNYVLYRAADRPAWLGPMVNLAIESVSYGIRLVWKRRISIGELATMWQQLCFRLDAFREKIQRDRDGQPCPLIASGGWTPTADTYYRQWIEATT